MIFYVWACSNPVGVCWAVFTLAVLLQVITGKWNSTGDLISNLAIVTHIPTHTRFVLLVNPFHMYLLYLPEKCVVAQCSMWNQVWYHYIRNPCDFLLWGNIIHSWNESSHPYNIPHHEITPSWVNEKVSLKDDWLNFGIHLLKNYHKCKHGLDCREPCYVVTQNTIMHTTASMCIECVGL